MAMLGLAVEFLKLIICKPNFVFQPDLLTYQHCYPHKGHPKQNCKILDFVPTGVIPKHKKALLVVIYHIGLFQLPWQLHNCGLSFVIK